jgi:hypothetical protein
LLGQIANLDVLYAAKAFGITISLNLLAPEQVIE